MCMLYHVLVLKYSLLFVLLFFVKYLVFLPVPLVPYFKLTMLGMIAHPSQFGKCSSCAGSIACLSSNGQDLCWHILGGMGTWFFQVLASMSGQIAAVSWAEFCQHPSPAASWDKPQVPGACRTIHRVQYGSCMCSGHPAVNPQRDTVCCPQFCCWCLHPKNGKKPGHMRTSLDPGTSKCVFLAVFLAAGFYIFVYMLNLLFKSIHSSGSSYC